MLARIALAPPAVLLVLAVLASLLLHFAHADCEPAPATCGNLTVKYPFWLGSPSKILPAAPCGRTDFELWCTGNGTNTTASIRGSDFQVLSIDYGAATLVVSHTSVAKGEDGVCRTNNLHIWSSILPPSLFSISSTNRGLFFLYNCNGTEPRGPGFVNATGVPSCGRSIFTYLGKGYDPYTPPEIPVGGCTYDYLPVLASAAANATAADYGRMLKAGFLLEYDRDDSYDCDACVASGGKCTYTTRFACRCLDGTLHTTCHGIKLDESGNCSSTALDELARSLSRQKLLRVIGPDILIVFFAGVLVIIGLYMPQYRHRSVFRFFFLCATTLFLPILSYVVANGSTVNVNPFKQHDIGIHRLSFSSPVQEIMEVKCTTDTHLDLVLLWLGLAQIIGISTSTIVAADVREGQNNGVAVEVLIKAIWTWCLAANLLVSDPFSLSWVIFLLVLAKLVLKCFTYWMASRSLSHGRTPRVIVGYMMQLHQRSQTVASTVEHGVNGQSLEGSQHVTTDETLRPPPLIVMGEESQKIEKKPEGYFIKPMPGGDTVMSNSLVTIDKVWQLDDTLMGSMQRIKDLCLSFALFKLLRCRFAGYTVVEAGFTQAHKFLWQELVNHRRVERLFWLIEEELSFLHDYYYTSDPMTYSNSWLPQFSKLTSFISLFYCILVALYVPLIIKYLGAESQISCDVWCVDYSSLISNDGQFVQKINIGSLLFDIVLISFLLLLVVLTEGRNIASNIFSNWRNVSLICQYVKDNDTTQRPFVIPMFRRKLMRHRMDKMNQCSVLVLHPRWQPTVLFTRLLFRLCLSDQSKTVKVPPVVKAAIMDTIRRNNGVKISGEAFSPRTVQDGGNFIWDCSDKGVAQTILICHVATSLLELRRPRLGPVTADETTATHLSHYCAYLVSNRPEVLPDDDRWCESLYKAVKKNSLHLLSCGVSRYQPLVQLLSIPDAHEVLQKGAFLAGDTRLVQEDGSTAWGVLAKFWTEMILHAASSSKPDDHKAAMAGGAEFITLLWALVMHVGPNPAPETATPTASSPASSTAQAAPAPDPATVPAHDPGSVAPSSEIELAIAD